MKKLFLLFAVYYQANYAQSNSILVYRSEYENTNDIIYDINDSNENTNLYSIISGNTNNYYEINPNNGKLKIVNTIPDLFDVIHSDNLIVAIGTTNYSINIVDAYDYLKASLSTEYSIMPNDNQVYIDLNSNWTAYNNLWGKGTAIENQDFRISILKKNTFPNGTIILWDVPSQANVFNGAAVWCYTNLFWGNRKNIREDLVNFPFQINSINDLQLHFNFEKLLGTDDYKVALNLFTTDSPNLVNFSENKGDFFFVFDQINNYLPPYPFSLPDISLYSKPFAVLYDNVLNGEFYERRRVIVKNGDSLTQGTINLKSLFDMFSNANYLNVNQFIPNIQVGLEITNGFGALRFNQLEFQHNLLSSESYTKETVFFNPNPVDDQLFFNLYIDKIGKIQVFNTLGEEIKVEINDTYINFASLEKGIYFLKLNSKTFKIIKN